MKEILVYYLLNGPKDWKDKRMFDSESSIDIDSMFKKARSITKAVIFDLLFEDPYEDLVTSISLKTDDTRVEFVVIFRDAFYDKHIGKYVDGETTLNKLKDTLEKELIEVCWRKVAKGGKCDGKDG